MQRHRLLLQILYCAHSMFPCFNEVKVEVNRFGFTEQAREVLLQHAPQLQRNIAAPHTTLKG